MSTPSHLACLLLLASTAISACGGDAAAGRTETLILTGSSTVAPLATELGVRFEEQNPTIRVDVQSGGSSRGIADARSGHAQIGMASRALKASESDLAAETIARDGVGLIVHASNPLTSLDAEAVRGIYTGKITDWSELGGTPGRITVVNKAEGRATLAVFLEHFGLESRDVHADVIAGENEQAIKTIAGTTSSIGYVSIGTAEIDIEAGIEIKLLALDGVPATTAAVADGSYPMARPLNLVTFGDRTDWAQRFIDFAHDPKNADLILRESFVPISKP